MAPSRTRCSRISRPRACASSPWVTSEAACRRACADGETTCRQQPNCSTDNSDYIFGADGRCFVNGWAPRHEIEGARPWRYPSDGPRPNMYQVEHDELFASIRNGKPINDGVWMAHSTLMALMGRMAAYTGQQVSWEFVTEQSTLDLFPKDLAIDGPRPKPAYAVPGVTKLV